MSEQFPEGQPIIQQQDPPRFSVAPYPLYQGEPIADVLRGRKASEFPSRIVYPPPAGRSCMETPCGCLYTTWPDDVVLETIWQPQWSVMDVVPGIGELRFFQEGGWPHEAWATGRTSLGVVGKLTWPKRFHLWEVEVFCMDVKNLEKTMLGIRIGEKTHLDVSLEQFVPRPAVDSAWKEYRRLFFPLPLPLYLPPDQNFSVSLRWLDGVLARHKGRIRCALNGYLSREIP